MKHKILWADKSDSYFDEFRRYFDTHNFKSYKIESISHFQEYFNSKDYSIVITTDKILKSIEGIKSLNRNKTNLIILIDSEDFSNLDSLLNLKKVTFLHKSTSKSNLLIHIKGILFNEKNSIQSSVNSFYKHFKKLQEEINSVQTFPEFSSLYSKLVSFDLDLCSNSQRQKSNLLEALFDQANFSFFKFIRANYENWLDNSPRRDFQLSHEIFKNLLLPKLRGQQPHLLIVMDNMRLDQYCLFDSEIKKYYQRTELKICCSLLPTTTQYSRNALFSGLYPDEIAQKYPELWVSEMEIGGKNNYEQQLLEYFLKENKITNNLWFLKSTKEEDLKRYLKLLGSGLNGLFTLVCNSLDQLSHENKQAPIIQNINSSKDMYRSYSALWFKNSGLMDLIKRAGELGFNLTIGTDHGSKRVIKPLGIISTKNISKNLRYKIGQSMSSNSKNLMRVNEIKNIRLPQAKINESALFAGPSYFFTYPNNSKSIIKRFQNSLQHGGISLEEMCIPWANYIPKK
jgi:DNA-binding response OmpR family regulator